MPRPYNLCAKCGVRRAIPDRGGLVADPGDVPISSADWVEQPPGSPSRFTSDRSQLAGHLSSNLLRSFTFAFSEDQCWRKILFIMISEMLNMARLVAEEGKQLTPLSKAFIFHFCQPGWSMPMAGGPYHISDDEHGPYVVIFAAILMTYMILCYLMRLLLRFTINGPLGLDDWTVTAGSVVAIVQTALKISEAKHGLGKRTDAVSLENRDIVGKVVRWYIVEGLGIFVELIAAWLPVYLVWNLRMRLKSKFVVLLAFSFRLPVFVIAAFRIYFLHQEFIHNDPLFYGASSSVCLEAALHFGLMAATIPCMKPFIKAFNTGWLLALDTSTPSEGYALSNMHRTAYSANAETQFSSKSSIFQASRQGHVLHQEPGTPSSAGSDKMIIRRTTAWNRPAVAPIIPKPTAPRTASIFFRRSRLYQTSCSQSYHSGRRYPLSSRTCPQKLQKTPGFSLSPRSYHSEFHPDPPADSYTPEQSAILSAALTYIPEHGFSTKSVVLGAREAGYLDVSLQLFPRGGELELVIFWLASRRGLLKQLVESGEVFADKGGPGLSASRSDVDQRVKALIIERLKMNQGIIQHWQDALAIMSLPSHISPSLYELYKLSSEILYLANDRSIDASWYTRRLSVAAVYASAEVNMTEDKSPGFISTIEFVERRIHDANLVTDTVGDVKQYLGYIAGSVVAAGRSWGMKLKNLGPSYFQWQSTRRLTCSRNPFRPPRD
ncbi:conserved hypothetical protein [Uncinocarpus reesii 1704]|uniref:Uncharacterized protein n=1 Tax=Uncinocarpus reesii (strain UAMH 1704) TaxID=336963 RepID=C4JSN2_UNCRE|nr:uncharacterized protein UREG_05471 [Uncinocarpus reesii 1704]EEP80629.1 conserved hypothetical protein [Uncinocarpus reesii 1704]